MHDPKYEVGYENGYAAGYMDATIRWESKYEDGFGWLVDEDFEVLGWQPLPEPIGGYMLYFSEEWMR